MERVICDRCGKRVFFYLRVRTPDGLDYVCGDCQREGDEGQTGGEFLAQLMRDVDDALTPDDDIHG